MREFMKIEVKTLSDPAITQILIEESQEPLVDLRDQSEILFGSPPERPDNSCYTKVRKSVYERLCEAQKLLPDGMRICLYEGWRSLALQDELFRAMHVNNKIIHPEMTEAELFKETTKLVSPVKLLDGSPNIPPHSTGGAVDVYLVSSDGKSLDMGMKVDQWMQDKNGLLSQTNSDFISEEAHKNRSCMSMALSKAGFVNYPYEYWHWSYGDRFWAYHKKMSAAIYGSVD